MGHHLHWALHLLRGHFAEAEEVLRGLRGSGYPCPGLLEAVTAVEQGDAAPALRLIAEHADRPAPYPRAYLPLWLRLLAQTAALTGDPRLIARAEDELTPYTGQWIVSLSGCDISGPVDLWLGMLAAARDDRDAAAAALIEAAASSDRLGARPWAVRSRLHLAQVLLARGGADDEARRLLHDVAREAGELALDHWASEAAAALRTASAPASAGPRQHRAENRAADRTDDQPTTPTDSTEPTKSTEPTEPTDSTESVTPAAPAEFRRNGPVWQLGWGGVTVHVPDAKGLRDLHSLLGLPGTDVPAVRLLAPEGGELVLAAGQLGGDPVLDDEAKRRYKQHLDRLDAAMDRAAARDDTRQVEAYDRERQALLDELRTAAGLGGRARRLGDQTERARKTVTARIRDTLRKLDPLHPALAAHLRASVTTGTTCAYRPDPTPRLAALTPAARGPSRSRSPTAPAPGHPRGPASPGVPLPRSPTARPPPGPGHPRKAPAGPRRHALRLGPHVLGAHVPRGRIGDDHIRDDTGHVVGSAPTRARPTNRRTASSGVSAAMTASRSPASSTTADSPSEQSR